MHFLALFAALSLVATGLQALPVINEVQSSNTSLPDQYGQLIDWVEIHNPTSAPINLQGYYLSDSLSSRTKFMVPAVTLGPGAYLLVWCGQASEFATTGPYPAGQLRATNFSISSGGETIVLTAPDGSTTVDEYPALPIGTSGTPAVGRSLGRGTGPNLGVLYFYNTPTRAAANTTAGTEAIPLAPPVASLSGGIYSTGQTVSLSTVVDGGVIRYSLDGSEPTESSPVYSTPLSLGTGGNDATFYSWIPTNEGKDASFPQYDDWRWPLGPVARIHVLRARVFQPGGRTSSTVTKSYVIDPAGTNRHAFPVVSIATDPANLFDDRTGIYVPGTNTYSTDWPNTPGAVPGDLWANYYQSGSAWERSSHIEFFERDGTRLFEGTIGLRLNGNTTRARPRKALRVYNRNPSGPTTWTNTPLFPDRDVRSWDTFLLRAAGNDWNQALFRDALVSSIAAPTGIDRQAARPVVVFLNGEYWGLHNLRERIDDGWFFHRYGLSADQFTLLEVTAGGPNFLNPTSDNSWPVHDAGVPALLDDYKDILARAGNNEFSGSGGYAALDARIDATNFIDYSALTIWAGNTDWPGNNVLLWRSTTNIAGDPRRDGRWRYILKDNDFALGLNLPYVPGHDYNVTTMAQHDTLAYATSATQTTFANNEIATRLLRKALANDEFRNRFINRFADLLNTTLAAATTTAALDGYIAAYQPGIAEHFARWPVPLNWTNEVERIRGYLLARPAAVRGHLVSKFGLAGTAQLGASVANTNHGVVLVNTLRLEPSNVGVGTNSANWTGTYFRGVPVTLRAEAKPGYRFSGWSRSVASPETVHATDAATNYPNWTNGSNLGSGFTGWLLTSSTSNTSRAGRFLDNGRGGWGLYANNGESSSAGRPFAQALTGGRTLAVRLQHGTVSSPGSLTVQVVNSGNQTLCELERAWNSSFYRVNGLDTPVAVTTAPLDVEYTPTSSNGFSLKIAPVGGTATTVTGTLLANTNTAASRVNFRNYSAGSGSGADLFITSLRIFTPGSAVGGLYTSYSTNSVLTETLTGDAAYRASYVPEPATSLVIVPPATGAAGTPLAAMQVRAVNSIGDADGNYQGLVILTVTGAGGFSQTLQANAVNGVAEFTGLNLPTAGAYTLNAASGSLGPAPSTSFTASDSAVFLPLTNAVWHTGTNWDTGTVPDGNRAVVTIPANPAADRDVTNNAPTTVASIRFDNGSSAFRNRINGIAGQPLVLASTGGVSTVTVTGTGAGYGNIEVAGGVVLSNDLVVDVQNIAAGNAEYGAFRLQGTVSGPGRIIKRGAGLAGITGSGKTFSGDIVVEQGVLTFSEPAVTGNNATNYTVGSGGQLRLSSSGNPRNYRFKGPLHLAGSGRSGVPESENLGVLGALRLETGTTGTTAVLTNLVNLAESADIHVPAGNAIQLDGPLTAAANTNVLTKSGGGSLTLSAVTEAFIGGLSVNRGTLVLGNAQLTNTTGTLLVGNEAVLAGTGRWGGGLHLLGGASIAANLGAAPGAAPLRAGSANVSGPAIVNVTMASNAVAGSYPLLSADGGITGATNLQFTVTPSNFPYATLALSNNTLHVVLANAAPGPSFDEWSGGRPANSDDDANGYTALAEFAFGAVAPGAPFTPPFLSVSNSGLTNFLTLTAVIRTNRPGLNVAGEAASSLAVANGWSTNGVEVITTTDNAPADHEQRTYRTPATNNAGFLRLRFELAP